MSTLTEFLTGIANAIRGKTGGTAQIPAQNFAAEIAAIETGTDTSDATAGAAQILAPYTAYGANGKLTGTMPEADVSASIGDAVSTGLTTRWPVEVSVNTPGYISDPPDEQSYLTLMNLSSRISSPIIPSTQDQTAALSGAYCDIKVTVSGDPNLTADNIKEGVSIFGVAGSYGGGSQSGWPVYLDTSMFAVYVINADGTAYLYPWDAPTGLLSSNGLYVIWAIAESSGMIPSLSGEYEVLGFKKQGGYILKILGECRLSAYPGGGGSG